MKQAPDQVTGPDTLDARPGKGGRLGWLRAICFGYLSVLLSMTTCLVGIPLMILGPSGRVPHALARLWGHLMLWCFGAGVRIENAERLRGNELRLIVSNHASYLDIPVLFGAVPGQGRFVLKKELMRLPFIGWFAWCCGHFVLDRENPREGKRLLDRVVARTKRYGLRPIVFPEGTRTHDGRLAPLKAGVFQLAIAAQIPIQPIAIFGTYSMMPRGSTYPLHAGEVLLKVGEPISIEGFRGGRGRRALTDKVHQAFLDLGVPIVSSKTRQ